MASTTARNGRPAGRNDRTPNTPRHAESMVVRAARDVRKAAKRPVGSDEIGTTGLRQYGGFVLEEWLRQLSGRQAAWAWREMMDNSPIIGAILFAIEWLARSVEWSVEPGNDTGHAEFVEECMGDMSHTWQDFISEALSCLPYGWAWHETVYKRRSGPQKSRPNWTADTRTAGLIADTQEDDSNVASSKYKDGRVGWRKLPIRAQETLHRWQFDGYSGIQALEQIDWHGGHHVIPIEKSLLFRSRARRNNPEGYSILRNAYVPYFRLKNIETIEAIGIERDLAGIPVIAPPAGFDIYSPANAEVLAKAQELVTSIRRDEYEGVVKPDAEWVLELLSSGGSRQIDTDQVVRRYEQRIATSMLADFILIGQDAVGSFAMVDVKADLFGMAIDGVLDLICEVLNRYAIPRLLALNGMDASEPPQITHASAGRIDLQKVGEFLQAMSLAGAPIPWTEALVKHLFGEAGLPTDFELQAQPEKDPVESPDVQDGLDDERVIEQAQAQRNDQQAARAEAVQKAAGSGGAMVALYPPPDVAAQLAQPGGEPIGDLHLTLAYLGDASAITDPDRLCQAVSGFAATCPPLSGQVSGVGHFTAGPEPVTYASADVPGLPHHRQRLVDTLHGAGTPPSDEHGFTPHITLAYDERHPHVENHPLTFDHIVLKLGDRKHTFALTGIQKAEQTATRNGTVVHVAPVLNDRANLLAAQLEKDLTGALAQLGSDAAKVYLSIARKADKPTAGQIKRIISQLLDHLRLGRWVTTRLMPLLRNHAGRTMADTQRILQTEIGIELHIADTDAQQIIARAGKDLRLADIEPQVRAAIAQAIEEGFAAGDNPLKTAKRIQEYVPAGRFVHAGSKYRAVLIARSETMDRQREASLAAYRSNPRITAIQARDGVFGEPRSDAECIARDGRIVPIDQAAELLQPLHPQCTLSYSPVVTGPLPQPAIPRVPELAGVS